MEILQLIDRSSFNSIPETKADLEYLLGLEVFINRKSSGFV